MEPRQGPSVMHGRRGTALAFLLILPSVLAGCLGALDSADRARPAPHFTVTDTEGVQHNLSDYQGRVLLLDFMATSCVPCKEEIGEFREIRGTFEPAEVAILSVSVDPADTDADLHEFQGDHAGLWDYARDTDGLAGKYHVIGIPKLVVIDPDQRIVHEREGVVTADQMADLIRRHLPEVTA